MVLIIVVQQLEGVSSTVRTNWRAWVCGQKTLSAEGRNSGNDFHFFYQQLPCFRITAAVLYQELTESLFNCINSSTTKHVLW